MVACNTDAATAGVTRCGTTTRSCAFERVSFALNSQVIAANGLSLSTNTAGICTGHDTSFASLAASSTVVLWLASCATFALAVNCKDIAASVLLRTVSMAVY